MTQQDVTAELALIPIRLGFVAGAGSLGVAALLIVSTSSSRPLATLVSAVLFAAFFGALTWLAGRRHWARLLADLRRTSSRVLGTRGQSILRGLALALGLALIETLVVGVFARAWGTEQSAYLLPGILLGVTLAGALGTRDLRRWQEGNGLVLYTRRGARRTAFTRQQAAQRLVVVPRNDELDDVTA